MRARTLRTRRGRRGVRRGGRCLEGDSGGSARSNGYVALEAWALQGRLAATAAADCRPHNRPYSTALPAAVTGAGPVAMLHWNKA